MAKKVPKRILVKAKRIVDQMLETSDVEKLGKLFDQIYEVNAELEFWRKKNLS